MKILITGSAGFIGFHISRLFLQKGHHVYGIDSLNRYYDVKLKKARNNRWFFEWRKRTITAKSYRDEK